MCLFIGIHQTAPSQFHQLLGGCQRADNHLQSPLGHSLNMHVIGDLSKKRGEPPRMHTAMTWSQLTGDLTVLKDQFTGVRPSHSQLIKLLRCAETWGSLQKSQDIKTESHISQFWKTKNHYRCVKFPWPHEYVWSTRRESRKHPLWGQNQAQVQAGSK